MKRAIVGLIVVTLAGCSSGASTVTPSPAGSMASSPQPAGTLTPSATRAPVSPSPASVAPAASESQRLTITDLLRAPHPTVPARKLPTDPLSAVPACIAVPPVETAAERLLDRERAWLIAIAIAWHRYAVTGDQHGYDRALLIYDYAAGALGPEGRDYLASVLAARLGASAIYEPSPAPPPRRPLDTLLVTRMSRVSPLVAFRDVRDATAENLALVSPWARVLGSIPRHDRLDDSRDVPYLRTGWNRPAGGRFWGRRVVRQYGVHSVARVSRYRQ